MFLLLTLTLSTIAASHPAQHAHHLGKRNYGSGIATFNDYAAQGNTNCGPSTGQHGTYGAAASDLSPDISGGMCSGELVMSHCAGQSVAPGYQAPGCPKKNCGKCYKVTNKGGVGGGKIGGIGRSITVQIIDACPSKSAYNFCKTKMPANERCGDAGTNQLDIDQTAYIALTGQAWGSGGPNLNVGIEDSDCAGAPSIISTDGTSSADDLELGRPGQHGAGGDKLAKNPVEGNLNVQELGSSDGSAGSPSAASLAPSSTTAALPTSVTPTSSLLPIPSPLSGVDSTHGEETEEDEVCDEL